MGHNQNNGTPNANVTGCKKTGSGTVESAHTGASNDATNSTKAGGVVGQNSGTVQNYKSNTAAVKSDNGWHIGGVVGYNTGAVTNCTKTDGDVSGLGSVGGIVGYLAGGTLGGSDGVNTNAGANISGGSNVRLFN